MADRNDKWEDNAPGRFYVDRHCLFCCECQFVAKNNFRDSEDGTHSYVYKQPETHEEEQACMNAMDHCPLNAIGCDAEGPRLKLAPKVAFEPDQENRHKENVPGRFYVDRHCRFCALCVATAPHNMRQSEDGSHSYVYKQPQSHEEENACRRAVALCPAKAIGRDGDGIAGTPAAQ